MANEISVSASLSVRKGFLDSGTRSRTRSFTLNAASPAKAAGVPSIGTTHEALPLVDVGTPGWARFENVDATNYVEIGIVVSATFYPFLKLMPGEFACVRLGTSAPYAKANTAAVKLDYEIYDD